MLGFGARSSTKSRQKLVQAGAIFCHVHPHNLVEKARVISIGPGPSDIPAVRGVIRAGASPPLRRWTAPAVAVLLRRVLSRSVAGRHSWLSSPFLSRRWHPGARGLSSRSWRRHKSARYDPSSARSTADLLDPAGGAAEVARGVGAEGALAIELDHPQRQSPAREPRRP